jgi:hypothetical protein
MGNVALDDKIPNNVNLSGDRKLQKALESLGGAGGLSVRSKAALRQRVSARGVLVWGPHSDPATEAVDGWSMVTLTRPCVGDEDEVLLVAGRQAALPPTDLIEGFRALGGGVAAT